MAQNTKQPKTLTLDQQRKLFLKPCSTKAELKAWIKRFFGLELPDCTVSRYADTNPLDLIWEIYEMCVIRNNPQNIKELLCVAGRGSGKTLSMAVVELMVMLHDKRDVVHVGAIQNQADRCYAYQKGFLYHPRLKDIVSPKDLPEDQRILEKANMSNSVFNVGSEKVTMEVLPCTLKSVNGPHVPLVVVDEIDTVSGEGVKAFADISGMLDSKGGRQSLRLGISTRKSRYGLMNKQIEDIESSPDSTRQTRKWTAFEFTERCSDERSGTEEVILYVNQDDLDTITEDVYLKKDKSKQKDYVQHKGFNKCAKCPLFPICLTDAKKQASKSPMLKPLDDVVAKVYSEGADWALAQLMNLKPSVEGIVYKEFDEKIHTKTWNEMWFRLIGKEFPGECTHDIFVKKVHELKLPVYAGIDWGWSNPNTVVFFAVDSRENIYVLKVDAMTYVSQPTWIHHIKTKYHLKYRCQLYFPDAADQGAIQEMQKAGLPASNAPKGEINTGIQVIKKFLRTPGSNEPKILFAKDTCQFMINEFSMYHFKTNTAGDITEDPEGEFDHSLDALRYALTQLFGKTNIIMGGGLEIDSTEGLTDGQGSYHRTPTAVEFAASKGIQLNQNEQDVSKLGKIGTKSELEDESDEGSTGGSFLWSF